MTRLRHFSAVIFGIALLWPAFDAGAEECPEWEHARLVGNLSDEEIDESSGLASSRANPDRLWTHNDSGDSPRLFLIDDAGDTRATVRLEGIAARDWEDMAVGPCGARGTPKHDESCVYVADIGDNLALLDSVVIYRFPEPEISTVATVVVSDHEALTLTYVDGSRDAEALLVHPSGRIFIVDKVEGGTVQIYEVPAKFGETVMAKVVATQHLGEQTTAYPNLVTAGDFAPDGSAAVLKTYNFLYTFCGPADDPVALLRSDPRIQDAPLTRQGEALAWDHQEPRIWFTSERLPAPLFYQPRDRAPVAGVDVEAQPPKGVRGAEAPPVSAPEPEPQKDGCSTASGHPGVLATLLLSLVLLGRRLKRRRLREIVPEAG